MCCVSQVREMVSIYKWEETWTSEDTPSISIIFLASFTLWTPGQEPTLSRSVWSRRTVIQNRPKTGPPRTWERCRPIVVRRLGPGRACSLPPPLAVACAVPVTVWAAAHAPEHGQQMLLLALTMVGPLSPHAAVTADSICCCAFSESSLPVWVVGPCCCIRGLDVEISTRACCW